MQRTDIRGSSRDVRLTWPVWGAIYLGIAAATLPAVLPVMVGVLADKLSFGVVRAGYVASANMGGIALGSVTCAVLARRWSWQTLIRGGAAVMICTNLFTMMVSSFPAVTTMRFFSGLGEGVIGAVCYAAMAQSRQPGRALAFYLAGQGLLGAVGLGVIPTVVVRAGWPWLFVLISIVALPAFWLARPIDTLHARPVGEKRGIGTVIPWQSWYALSGILVYFVGMSAVWAFFERMGHAKHIDVTHLSIALSASSVAGMVGSLLVAFAAHRMGVVTGLATGLAIVLAGLLALLVASGWQAYLAAAAMFFFAWGFYYPFQFRLLAHVDVGGESSILLPAVSGIGLTVGPAIGGLLLAHGGTVLVCAFSTACVIASTGGALHLHFHSPGTGEQA